MKGILEQNGGFFIEFEMLAEMENALQQLFGNNVVVKERKCASWEGKVCEFEFQVVGNGE